MNEESKKQEEDIKIYEEAVSIDRSRQKSRRVFVFYIVGLFCVALGLILLSYVMQAHANSQLEDLGAQLTEQTDAATGAKARADQLQVKMDALQEQLDESQQQNKTMQQTVEQQKKNIEALDSLWQLERAVQDEDMQQARSIIRKLDSAYTREVLTDSAKEPLSGDAAQEYANICDELGF
ncbi:MAG: hypothetical protein Q4P20_02665 [Eubacteriales bacterium]|nr:hypothetical protein [Eubacteriales bacterium]